MYIMDYYRTLGLTPEASEEEIKRAYRTLALRYHPDRNGDDPDGEEKLKKINEAYHTLGDKQRKRAYDLMYRHHRHDEPFMEGDASGLDEVLQAFFTRHVEVPGRYFCKKRGLARRGCRRWKWNL